MTTPQTPTPARRVVLVYDRDPAPGPHSVEARVGACLVHAAVRGWRVLGGPWLETSPRCDERPRLDRALTRVVPVLANMYPDHTVGLLVFARRSLCCCPAGIALCLERVHGAGVALDFALPDSEA